MIKSYFKILFRNLFQSKAHSIINIVGLSVGLASSILIITFIWHELSYDNFHPDVENTYRVYCDQPGNFYMSSTYFNVMPMPFQPEIKSRYPEVKCASRLTTLRSLVTLDHVSYTKESFYAVDQDFLNMFDVQMIYGQKKDALTDPHSLLLSKSVSEKYFGQQNPIGELIYLNDTVDFVVRGVFKDVSKNSHFEYDMLVPFAYVASIKNPNKLNNWGNHSATTYVQISEDVSKEEFENKLIDLVIEKRGDEIKERYYLQAVRDIHLYGKLNFEISANGDIKYVLIFGTIALFLLLIAAFNYMNLATARSLKRAKEVSIRKVIGASRKQLFCQFIGESLFYTTISLLISLILIEIFEPVFNNFIGRKMSFYGMNPAFYFVIFAIVLFIAFVAGSYPATYLSRFSPVKVLKGAVKGSQKSIFLRNSIVVVQFFISVVLVICTLVVIRQMGFIKNTNLGFDTENILAVPLSSTEVRDKFSILKNELLSHPEITEVTSSDFYPSKIQSLSSFKYQATDGKKLVNAYFINVDYNFTDLYNIQLQKGESFKADMGNGQYLLINEEAEKSMGIENVIGSEIEIGGPERIIYRIIGVVKNFHFAPLSQIIQPACIVLSSEGDRKMTVKVAKGKTEQAIEIIESLVIGISSKNPFSFTTIEETIDSSYREENKLSSLFTFFTVVAVIIACLGLFGLISFVIDQRTKEIGIRKILGASMQSILALLSKNMVLWVLLSNFLAWPVAWYFMDKWLQNFAYSIKLDIGIFLSAGFITLIIALLTTGVQTVKSAMMNPIETLKYE